MARLGVDGIVYLQTRTPQGVNAEAEVNVSLSIANLILYGWKIDAEPIQQLFSEQPSEVSLFKLFGIRARMDHIAEICTATKHKCVECTVVGGVVPQISRPRRTVDEEFSGLCHRVSGIIGCIFLCHLWHRECGG